MNKAKIMVFEGQGQPMSLQEQTIPDLKSGEILVKNLYTSICGSDLHTYCGLRQEKVPTVLGHEIVGEIISFSDDHSKTDHLGNKLNVGDRVTWSIFSSDPDSELSKAGMPQKGERLFKYGHAQVTIDDALHGGLSTHCILKPGTAILGISKEVPLPVAAIINCAVATVAGALRLAGNLSQKTILITGSGLLGMVCAAMCKVAGAGFIHIADINPLRLEQASDFGANETHLLTDSSVQLPGGIDVAFDMSGSADAMENSLSALAIGGKAVWIGAVFNTRKVQVDAESIVRRLITIKGLHNYNFEDFVYAVNFISKNHQVFPFEKVVSKEFSLLDTNEAFKYAVANKPLRVGINLDQQTGQSNG
ncbi:zinc-binding dehydrogenase [Pedobacter nyackensis]|uniref:zinc-binding dehydrogenase n=1 Tax=Pedobacter nyackensis TaxID=475255 RepID=UPI002931198E|nr:zinc-binding dehydrogenase [Pedobacter nyackensis]